MHGQQNIKKCCTLFLWDNL